jgi:hypothetical protein
VTYQLSHQPALATGPTFAAGAFGSFAGGGFASSTVAVATGASVSVDVTITPPAGALRVYGGYLVVTPQGGQPLRVPYAGIVGDYQAIQVLAAGGCALSPFPGIFKQGGETVCVAATPTAPSRTARTAP